MVLDGLRLDHAGVVDCVGEQASRCLRGHQHLAAIGPDDSAVFSQRVDRAFINGNAQQLVARHVKRDGVACGQRNRAELGRNHTLVADVRTQQGHIAAIGRVDRSPVFDRARTRTRKFIVARHEVGIADGQGGRHQAAHIDRRATAKQDAVGVDQEHLAVRRQAAQNARRIGADDPVERDGTGARLHELHGLPGLDAKALPVDGYIGRALGDRHVACRTPHGGCACGHHAAHRLGLQARPAGQH